MLWYLVKENIICFKGICPKKLLLKCIVVQKKFTEKKCVKIKILIITESNLVRNRYYPPRLLLFTFTTHCLVCAETQYLYTFFSALLNSAYSNAIFIRIQYSALCIFFVNPSGQALPKAVRPYFYTALFKSKRLTRCKR